MRIVSFTNIEHALPSGIERLNDYRRMFELRFTWNCINFWINDFTNAGVGCNLFSPVNRCKICPRRTPMRRSHVVHNCPISNELLLSLGRVHQISRHHLDESHRMVQRGDCSNLVTNQYESWCAIDHEYVPCSKWADNLLKLHVPDQLQQSELVLPWHFMTKLALAKQLLNGFSVLGFIPYWPLHWL